MQRILNRKLLARNQALKGSRRQAEKQVSKDNRKARQEAMMTARLERSSVKSERINRREDWMLGPLAPNRAAGKDGGGYGMLSFSSTTLPFVAPSHREEYFNFAAEDRVVVVKGRERGKIGKVKETNEERQSLMLTNVNMVSTRSVTCTSRDP